MGANCCSHAKEPPEITILKPEKNMSTTSQNPIINNQKNDVNNNNNNNEQIVVMQQVKDGTSENFTNIKFEKEFENAFTQPFDINTLYNSENNSNNPLSFNKKELDDVFNQGFRYVRKSFLVEGNNNLNNNIITENNNINNNVITENNNNNGINIDEIMNQQNQEIQYNQNIQVNDDNNQNINNQMNEKGQKIEQILYPINQNQITTTTKNIQINQNLENIQQPIQNMQNIPNNQNIEIVNQNIINQTNETNEANNELDIDALLKNTSSGQNINTNPDMNFDIFFSQDSNQQINDDLFNKLFESAGKPVTQNQVNNQNPLYMSQQIKNNQNNLNNRYSPLNSPQRSEISEPAANANKLW